MRISGGERAMAALGYLAFLFILPVKLRRDSMFVQFHARQGGVLFGLWLLALLVLFIVLLATGAGGILASILLGVMMLLTGLYILLVLVGLLKVSLGERYRMPVVADVALLLRL
jgi:fumarate reductase subunit D